MCGIFGGLNRQKMGFAQTTLSEMARAIIHRGPDATGTHSDDHVALGNCRLAIIDLDARSNQPMSSDDGQIVLVQNGEIYNYIELRAELKQAGARFDTTGDTEVLLRAYELWGPGFITRLNGMFAIAVYDAHDRALRLYRDRLGVKPLYYFDDPDTGRFWFASEIKTLLATGLAPRPNYDALAQFLALNYVPVPVTAFEGIFHLQPGHWMEITDTSVTAHEYWTLADSTPDAHLSEADAKAELLHLLDDATRIRMRADAPFGAFLSGGLDSSSVVGMMDRHKVDRIKTFSIGFDDPRFDETEFAVAAAGRFDTDHTVGVMEANASDLWAKFIWHVDQPHGDVSFIPTLQVATLAAQDVKMVLTGDGGDELFAGYQKYASFFAEGFDPKTPNWEDQFATQAGLLQADEAQALLAGPLADTYRSNDPLRALSGPIRELPKQDPINRVLYAETTMLLPGNNLVKPDRMAMAASVEVRSPFLDYRMAEFAFRVPGSMKLKNGETKAIYKDAVEDLLGTYLTRRKKQMFTVPIGEWFRQKLAGFCRELLLDGRFGARGIIHEQTVSRMLADHISGEANYTRQIRALISLEIWFRLFIDQDEDWLRQAQQITATS